MKISNDICIRGGYQRIFDMGSRVEAWGRIMPHYRYVKVVREQGNRKLVRMSAWRDIIPVTWTAIETVEEGTPQRPGRILFHHVRGLVKGMDVEWSFEPRADKGDVRVTISHDLPYPPFPVRIVGRRLVEMVVGRGFIGYIANKTLRHIKEVIEA